MQSLDLLRMQSHLKIRTQSGKKEVFDIVRKKWLVLLPEELVRQLVIHYLLLEKGYPASLLRVEMGLTVNKNVRRCDVLAFNQETAPFLLVECKSPDVRLTDQVVQQISAYNLTLQVPHLLITNGRSSYCLSRNTSNTDWRHQEDIPPFPNRSTE